MECIPRTTPNANPPTPLKPVAVVGISADLPSGHHAEQNFDHGRFFEFLLNKGESYEPVPSERFNLSSWHGKALGQVNTAFGSFLKDVGLFDHLEFGITSKDVRAMALSTRKLLELSFLALLDSGIDYRGRNVGCYMSGVAFDMMSIADPDEFEARGSFSGIPCMIANRVSYHLDLLGPSVPTDTACSSTLTAMHLAVQALRSGDCESAVVGGCQLNHRLVDFLQYSQGSVLAPDGKCKPFDASADGFSRGEGAVVVVVKLLEDAVRDGDHIYASILGTGINSAGSAAPVSAPVADAQADAMRRAYRGTGRSPSEVDFVELHATGTAAGDPTEANWVGANFMRDDELLVGSVKGNIGHLEITAFLASLSKVCLMLKTGVIPPNVNFNSPNPAIKWREYKLRVPTEPEPLKARSPSGRPLISLSSSGIGGANGHVVLEGPPIIPKLVNGVFHPEVPVLLVAGGLTPRAATAVSESMLDLLGKDSHDLAKWSTLYGRRVRQMTWRTYAIRIPGQSSLTFAPPSLSPRIKPPIVFLFSGQGPQHINMGRQLFKAFPAFRQSVLEMDDVYRDVMGHSLVEKTGLFDDVKPLEVLPVVWPIWAILPGIAIVQIALFDLLCSLGIRPDIVVGHSAGETAMLYASGAATKAMAVELAIARGKAMTIAEEAGGTMAALSCGPKQAQYIIAEVTDGESFGKLEIACFNTHEAVAIAGLETFVDKAIEYAETQGILGRKIRTRVPVHSSVMEVCRERYQELIGEVFARYPGPHVPTVSTYSALTGNKFSGPFTASYMWENTRYPVLFTQAISSILSETPTASFIEISPHPALSSYLPALGAVSAIITCPMRRSKKVVEHAETRFFLESLGRLIMMGYNSVDFVGLNGQHAVDFDLNVPPYPFAKRFIDYYPETSSVVSRQLRARNGPLNHADLRINTLTHPELAQHVIKGEPIMPAAGYIEMAIEFGARTLWNVEFRSMLSLSSEKPLPVEVNLDGLYWTVKSRTLTSGRNDVSRLTKANRLHADGFLSRDPPSEDFPKLDIHAIRSRCQEYDLQGFYKTLASFAEYGPVFRRLKECYRAGDEVLVKVRGMDIDLSHADKYVLHPAILDACIHVMVHPAFTANADPNVYYLPSRVDLVVIHDRLHEQRFPSVAYGYATFRKWLPDGLTFDFVITNEEGERLCTMHSFGVAMHRHSLLDEVTERLDMVYQPFVVCPSLVDLGPAKGSDRTAERPNGVNGVMADEILTPDREPSNGNELGGDDLSPQVDEISISPSDKSALLERFRTCSSCISDCIRAIQDVLEGARESGKRVVKVLEVGAEHGCLSEHVYSLAAKFNLLIQYFVADESMESAQRAARSSTRPVVFDPSDPSEYQLPAASFDLVIGLHALVSLYDPSKAVSSLGRLLLPGGSLVLRELDRQALSSSSIKRALWLSTEIKPSTWQQILRNANFGHIQVDHDQIDDPFNVLVIAQKPSLPVLTAENDLVDEPWILNYIQGYEMYIQSELIDRSNAISTTLWLTATKGPDGDAALGFARSLRREFLAWQIFLVVFDNKWSDYEQTAIVRNLSQVEGMESEVSIDEFGQVLVPRFVPSSAPITSRPFDNERFWTMDDNKNIRHVMSPLVPPDHVLVRIETLSAPKDFLCGLVGHVVDGGTTSLPVGSRVGSLTSGVLSNFAVVHEGSLVVLDNESSAFIASSAAASIACAYALGSGSIQHPSRLASRRVIVCDDGRSIAKSILQFCNAMGLQIERIPSQASATEFLSLALRPSDIILAHTKTQLLDSFVTSDTRFFAWSSMSQILSNDPWSVGDALQAALGQMQKIIPSNDHTRRPEDWLPVVPQSIKEQSLFSPNKAYLLLGGIGSLGLQIALWMYQHGARHLVLTSRSGRQSLIRAHNVFAMRILSYLDSLSDLSLSLEASDASSADSMTQLIQSLQLPLGGCMLLSGLVSDRTFLSQSAENFEAVFAPKKDAFEALESAVTNIEDMDFVITFSSVATFGNAGQTNYSSANTAIDGMTRKYRNAFSLIAPAVLDTTFVTGRPDYETQGSRLGHLVPWAYTSQQLCECLEDGIRKLSNGPFGLYIPAFNWDLVQKHMGPSPLYDHLAKGSEVILATEIEKSDISLKVLVLEHLDVSSDDFSAVIPFTTYGLDSLSAARLSYALRPFIAITQLQLLADLTLKDLELRIEERQVQAKEDGEADNKAEPVNGSGYDSSVFDWQEMHKSGQTVVKLNGYSEGVPLILIHGANGDILTFKPLQERFTTPLWAIQTTPETPTESIQAMAAFYHGEIKKLRPEGPYRIGGFSGTNLATMAMAQMFEANGDLLEQVLFLDHAPLLFASCLYEMDSETVRRKKASNALMRKTIEGLAGCYLREVSSSRKKVGEEIMDALHGRPVRPYIEECITTAENVLRMSVEFLIDLAGLEGAEENYNQKVKESLVRWCRALKSPVTVVVAKNGIVGRGACQCDGKSEAEKDMHMEKWQDLGTSMVFEDAKVVYLEEGHFGMFETDELVKCLERQ